MPLGTERRALRHVQPATDIKMVWGIIKYAPALVFPSTLVLQSILHHKVSNIHSNNSSKLIFEEGHIEIEHRYLQNVNERALRVKAWVTKKNEEQEQAKSAYAKEKQVYHANETARQQDLHNKTRFSIPNSIVPKSNGKHKYGNQILNFSNLIRFDKEP